VRNALPIGVALLAIAAGCSERERSPESVVRAWSTALNAGDNQRAASLFATGAIVVQNGIELRLRTRTEAVDWNASLPCSGHIVALSIAGETVTATFVLGDRPASPCDAPGGRARAVFRVRHGQIVLWHQLPTSAVQTPPPAAV
jgi:hypothetical protein